VRLAIGTIVSSGFRVDTDFLYGRPDYPVEGFFGLWSHIESGAINQHLPEHLKITGVESILSRKFPTQVARNEICKAVLDKGHDYLLFLDCDMVHPQDMLQKLLLHEKPVITARYHLKKAPFAAIAYVKHKTEIGPHRYASIHFGKGCFEIERAGAGALLIRRDVLQGIYDMQTARMDDLQKFSSVPDWFRKGYFPREKTVQWFKYQYGPEPNSDETVSEDFWFFQQAREAGFSCWCDWDVVVPHIGQMAIDDSFNRPFLHTQMSEYENPDARDMVLNNTIVRGYKDGMILDDGKAHIPEYQLTPGER
jgi:glycosyltransferase involved in cell wall biosynthesis